MGTSGNDTLRLESGGKTVIGGHGDDTIYDGAGNDTYVFNLGDGHDTIYGNEQGGSASYYDKISFGADITINNLVFTVEEQDWLITFKTTQLIQYV